MSKLEIYGVLLLLIGFGNLGCYVLGRWQEAQKIHTEQLAADAKELHSILEDGIRLRDADDSSRTAAEAFMTHVNQGLDNVNAKFAKLPNIVVDARGCAVLGDSFRLRFDAAADLPSGSTGEPAGNPPGDVPAAAMPSAR